MEHRVDIIDLRDTRDESLLERAYQELYLACFTDPDEQEDLEQYRERLFGPQQPPPQPKTHFLVAGERLNDSAPRILDGMLIFELYRESSCGLLTYLAVSPHRRGRGLGRTLMQQAIDILSQECAEANGLQAAFAETHDPALIDPADDAMSPRERIEVMKRLGAERVPVRYVQPELRPGDGRSRKLLLITFPLERDRPLCVSGQALLSFMHEFYRALGVAKPLEDADYQTMERDAAHALEGRPRQEVVRVANDLGFAIVSMRK